MIRAANGDVVGTDYATKVVLRDEGKSEELSGVDEVVPKLLYLLRDHNVTSIEANKISGDLP